MKILVVDDQEIARKGIRFGLAELSAVEQIDEATGGMEAIAYAQTQAPDIILMDIMMPGVNGLDATRQIKALNSNIKIVMMTSTYSEDLVLSALSAKTDALCLKSIEFNLLHQVLDTVMGGGLWLDDAAAACVIKHLALVEKSFEKNTASSKRRPGNANEKKWYGSKADRPDVQSKPIRTVKLSSLTHRENQVLSLITQGFSNKQIATELQVTIHTIKIHVSNIIQKLGVGDRTQAAILALEKGFIKLSG